MDLTHEKTAVTRTLAALDHGLQDLVNALAHSDALCVLEDRGGLRRACEAYATIDYGMEDQVNSSVVCCGAIAVSGDILKKAKAVNGLKAEFKRVCAGLANRRIRVPSKGANGPTEKIPTVRFILRGIGRSDLNLLAAYRNLPVLAAPPVSITYTRANTRAVYRKSVEDLYTLLNTVEGPRASADRARLSTLSPRETHLAFVKARYQNVRANVLYARLDRRGRGRIQIAAELPILYPEGSEDPEILFLEPEDNAPIPSHTREAQIEDKPFLETLPVYRYKR